METAKTETRDYATSAAYLAAASAKTGDTAKYPVGTKLSSRGVVGEVVAADGETRTVRTAGVDRKATVAQIDVMVGRGVVVAA